MTLTFANPPAFWLLFLIPVFIALKVLADLRARRAVTRLASPRLLDGLLVSEGRGRAWVVFSLELLTLVFFATALARPHYGSVVEESPGNGRSLIVAIDTSKSMKANDVLPTRLERAQLAAEDLVKRLRKDRIGLMPFAGSAFMYAPITPDTDALLESIQSLDTEIISRGGSNIARAIDLAIATFKKSDLSGQQAMVLFSDGEELEGEALAAARRARDARLAIICVAVGTPEGGLIPDESHAGGYFRDRDQKIVRTRLHKEVLVKIADLTGGLYLTLDGQGIRDSRIDIILAKLQRSAMKSKTTETAVDRYRWPLAAGLLTLTAAFLTGIVRRHRAAFPGPTLTAVAAVILCFAAGSVPAGAQEELLPPPDLEAPAKKPQAAEKPAEEPPKEGDPWKFYDEGDWKNSVFNFGQVLARTRDDSAVDQLQMARGVAAFKAAIADPEKFDATMLQTSMEAFGVALASHDIAIREKAHYNLGNAIFERAKAAEKQRALAMNKAKSNKSKKKHAITLKYLDSLIRQLENSLEHYQETLILNKDHADAKKNHDAVADLVKKLRDIREKKAQMGQGEGEGQGNSKGEGEGECDGQCEGEGQGKGKGKGQGSGEGDDESEGEDGEDEGPGKGKKGDEQKEGEGEGGKGKGEKGQGDDESNEEFEGNAGASGETGNGEERQEGSDEAGDDGEGGGGVAGEVARSETIRKLKNLSQELKSRPRTPSVPERRPAKDW